MSKPISDKWVKAVLDDARKWRTKDFQEKALVKALRELQRARAAIRDFDLSQHDCGACEKNLQELKRLQCATLPEGDK